MENVRLAMDVVCNVSTDFCDGVPVVDEYGAWGHVGLVFAVLMIDRSEGKGK